MTEASKEIWVDPSDPEGGWSTQKVETGDACYVPKDIADGYRDQRDAVIAAARKVILWAEMDGPDPEDDPVDALVAVIGAIDDAEALAKGDEGDG